MQLNNRKFETPYNFDKLLIPILKPYHDAIDTLYLPMLNIDGLTTRMKCRKYPSPQTRKEYEEHLRLILDNGYRPNLLIQDPIADISDDILKWYLSFGIKNFTVYQDRVALALRRLSPDSNIVASITKRLKPDDIRALPDGLYDNVVLMFAYNHSLDVINSLPDNVEYTMIANAECHQDCWGLHHWFPTLDCDINGNWTELPEGTVRKLKYCDVPPEESAIVMPQYLHYYDPKIKIYKLVDRAFPSYRILDFLHHYATCTDNEEASDDYLNRKNVRTFKTNIRLMPNLLV